MAKNTAEKIAKELASQITQFKPRVEFRNLGRIIEIGDGVARIEGLSEAMAGEVVLFPQDTLGLLLNLKKEEVGAVIIGNYSHLKEGDEAKATGQLLEVPVGERLIGRVVNPLGQPQDGKGEIVFKETAPLERVAYGVTYRQPVKTPLQTGIKAVDSMIPIGRGQRELIIGDRGTGKTAIALDTIINQKGKSCVCIYVAIGQKVLKVTQVAAKLEEMGAMDHTIVVAANASDPAPLQYLAPYAGCAIGEYFMEKGEDALVVFDDLSKHAWAYRQLSLLLRRPSGREAYPGDIFYLHSRLLERACCLSEEHGGGTLTALPIVETQAGDVSAYIPTNIISITDGQIYLESDLFHAGIRPALNVGLSVSRVGGAAQIKAMKQVAGRLRLDLAQYRELATFAQFGSDLDKTTQGKLNRGERISEVLKQPRYAPVPVEDQVVSLWTAVNGFLDDLPLEKIKDFEGRLLAFTATNCPEVKKGIKEKGELSQDLIAKLKRGVEEFKKTYG